MARLPGDPVVVVQQEPEVEQRTSVRRRRRWANARLERAQPRVGGWRGTFGAERLDVEKRLGARLVPKQPLDSASVTLLHGQHGHLRLEVLLGVPGNGGIPTCGHRNCRVEAGVPPRVPSSAAKKGLGWWPAGAAERRGDAEARNEMLAVRERCAGWHFAPKERYRSISLAQASGAGAGLADEPAARPLTASTRLGAFEGRPSASSTAAGGHEVVPCRPV